MKRLLKHFDLQPQELSNLELQLLNELITSPINKTEILYERENEFDYEFSWAYLDDIMLEDFIGEGLDMSKLKECSKEETFRRLQQLNFSVFAQKLDRCNCFTRLSMDNDVIRLKPTKLFNNLLYALHHRFNRLEIYTLMSLNEKEQSLYRLIKTSKEHFFKLEFVIRLLGLEKKIFFDDLRRNQNSIQHGLDHCISSIRATEQQQTINLGISGKNTLPMQHLILELDVNKECVFIQEKK